MTTKKCIVALHGRPAALLVTQTRYKYEVRFEACGTELGCLKPTDYGVAWALRCVDFRRRPLKGKAIHIEDAFDSFCKAALVVPLQLATQKVLTVLSIQEGLDASLDPKVKMFFDRQTLIGRHAVLKRLRDKFTHVDVSNPNQLAGLNLHNF